MSRSAARALAFGTLGVALLLGAPASAQDVLVADSLVWPSWSGRIAALGLAGDATPLAQWAAPERTRPRELCVAAGAAGYVAGLLADALRSEPVDWPAGFDYFPALSWRSLPKMGEAVGKAVVCPPPLTRTPADALVPARPDP